MIRIRPFPPAFLLAFSSFLAAQEPLVVIVHPESGVTELRREEVISLFMGRQRRLPSGLAAMPVEPTDPAEVTARFYRRLVNKDMAEINTYWARVFFTGQAQPPHRVRSAREVVDIVAANKSAVGFVERSRADRRVRVVSVLAAAP